MIVQNYYRKILPLILYWSVIARDFNGTQNLQFGMYLSINSTYQHHQWLIGDNSLRNS